MADGSVVFQSMQADDAMHVLIADSNGNVSPLFASPTDGSDIGPAVPNPFYYAPALFQLNNASYWTSSTWYVPDGSGGIDFTSGPISGPGSDTDCSAWTSAGGEPQRQSVGNPTATVMVNFTGAQSKGDQLTFSGAGACGQNLGLRYCPNASWSFYIEGVATVSDDASKWKIRQDAVITRAGNTKDTQGVLHAVNDSFNSKVIPGSDDPCVLNDTNPGCQGVVSVQQPAGQKTIYWLDHPGSLYQASADAVWDSLLENGLFNSKACNRFGICANVKWFIKLEVDPGSVLNCAQSLDGTLDNPITCP
ncbi:MAG TPA: hypothetical protein VI431_17340 [Candidatus Acidoferrum sp.]